MRPLPTTVRRSVIVTVVAGVVVIPLARRLVPGQFRRVVGVDAGAERPLLRLVPLGRPGGGRFGRAVGLGGRLGGGGALDRRARFGRPRGPLLAARPAAAA